MTDYNALRKGIDALTEVGAPVPVGALELQERREAVQAGLNALRNDRAEEKALVAALVQGQTPTPEQWTAPLGVALKQRLYSEAATELHNAVPVVTGEEATAVREHVRRELFAPAVEALRELAQQPEPGRLAAKEAVADMFAAWRLVEFWAPVATSGSLPQWFTDDLAAGVRGRVRNPYALSVADWLKGMREGWVPWIPTQAEYLARVDELASRKRAAREAAEQAHKAREQSVADALNASGGAYGVAGVSVV